MSGGYMLKQYESDDGVLLNISSDTIVMHDLFSKKVKKEERKKLYQRFNKI